MRHRKVRPGNGTARRKSTLLFFMTWLRRKVI